MFKWVTNRGGVHLNAAFAYLKMTRRLGGLRVTNPTIRLVCPSVRPSVRLSVCLSVRQHFACKHDNSTNIRRIDPKLIPWMYLRSVLVKFEDG